MTTSFNLTVHDVKKNKSQYVLVDVREAHELKGAFGPIKGSILATLGPALSQFLQTADPQKKYIFICQGGYRSAKACHLARTYGLTAYNMEGGMRAWQEMEVDQDSPSPASPKSS
jgi:rhodanese-related sulfurtransferase